MPLIQRSWRSGCPIVLIAGMAAGMATTTHAQVSGRVTDGVSGAPIAGALVSVRATKLRTVTAPSGEFSLPEARGEEVPVVAAHEGYYNELAVVASPVAGVSLVMSRAPFDEDPDYRFWPPASCGYCHLDQYREWLAGPMSNAGRNTWVYDLYDGTGTGGGSGGFVYTRDSVHREQNPASECASCHQPGAWLKEPFRGLEPIGSPSPEARDGVFCEVCHKVAHVDRERVNFPGLYPGVVTMSRPRDGADQVQYGTLGDAATTYREIMGAAYQPDLGALMCAACHQDKNDPDDDGDFEEENGVVSEPTYEEWLHSPYGDPESPRYTPCTGCHMPPTRATTFCWVDEIERPVGQIREHVFPGTTPKFLEHAVELRMDAVPTRDHLEVDVKIENRHAGHHVPTGVTMRNMILRVEAIREDDGGALRLLGGPVIDDLGGIGDPARGYLAGLPGKVYAKVAREAGGAAPAFFTEAVALVSDNRIPALSADSTRYVFALPEDAGAIEVRARLIYRRAFRSVIDAKGWTKDGHGRVLEDLEPPHFGHLMEEERQQLEVRASIPGLTRAPGSPAVAVAPNPGRPAIRVFFRLDDPAPVRLDVHDVQGRLIATPFLGTRPAGAGVLPWDGRGDDGRPVASGIYMVRLSVAARSPEVRRVVILR